MTKDSKVRTVVGLVVAGVLICGAAVAVSYAQAPAPRHAQMLMGRGLMGRGPLGAIRLGLAQLGLSDDQKQQIKGIVQGHRGDFQALQQQLRPARQALMSAIATGNETAIRDAAARLATAQTDAFVLAGKVRGEVFGVLTPDQKQKAADLAAQFQQRMQKRRALRKELMGL